jgi:hypothetical protein
LLPQNLFPLQTGEFLTWRADWKVTIDVVTVTATLADQPAFEWSKSYLLFLVTDERSQVAAIPLHGDGVFEISDRGDIRTTARATHPVVQDLRELHHNPQLKIDAARTSACGTVSHMRRLG